jgi:hypothetical protein
MGITMGSTIEAFRAVITAPAGSFTRLGAKRGLSVLWKAVRGKDVQSAFDRNTARLQGRLAVSNAMEQDKFTHDFAGLRDLLAAARDYNGQYEPDPITDQAFRAALFDAAWSATIAKGKPALRLHDTNGRTLVHSRFALRQNFRNCFADGKMDLVDKSLRQMLKNDDCLPRLEVGGRIMPRTRGWETPKTDLHQVNPLPRGIAAGQGSNYRELDPKTNILRPPKDLETKEAFAIRIHQTSIAVSMSPAGVASCKEANKALLGLPVDNAAACPEEACGYFATLLEDGNFQLFGTSPPGSSIWIYVPSAPERQADLANLLDFKQGVIVPHDAILVSLSKEATEVIGRVSKDAILRKLEEKVEEGEDDLVDVFQEFTSEWTTKMVAASQARARLDEYIEHIRDGKITEIPRTKANIDMVNQLLDGLALVNPEVSSDRLRMDDPEEEFAHNVEPFINRSDQLRAWFPPAIGGDLTVIVVSPSLVLEPDSQDDAPRKRGSLESIERSSFQKTAPPILERTDENGFLFDDNELHEGDPILKFRNQNTPPSIDEHRGIEVEKVSSSDSDHWDFDIDDYV